MTAARTAWIILVSLAAAGCAGVSQSSPATVAPRGTLAHIYYWKARAGQIDAYTRYIRGVAEPIDHDAQRTGAFISITTYLSRDPASPWTHMRVFILRDSVQLAALPRSLEDAGVRIEPDSAKRRASSEYGATLRDRVGDVTVELVP